MQGIGTISVAVAPSPVIDIEKHLQKESRESKIQAEDLNFYYGRVQALREISFAIPKKRVTAFIGASGCGKSTLLRTFSRMNDVIPGTRVEGRVAIDGKDIYGTGMDVVSLRRRVSDRTAFFWLGEMIEFNTTEKIFTKPDNRMTEDYITGRFG